ncbi:MAG TPA: TlpA disulfide reductase family protein, partial [Polyangiaceae bacterium]
MTTLVNRSVLVLIGALLLPLSTSCAAPVAPPASSPSSIIDKPLPEFRRTALDGTSVDTKALAGRVVVLELFAEHCVPCVTSLPAAEDAHRARPDAAFVGLSEDDGADGAARMAARHGLTFPVVHDAGRVLAGRLRLNELPATVIADRKGTIRWVGTRSYTTAEL